MTRRNLFRALIGAPIVARMAPVIAQKGICLGGFLPVGLIKASRIDAGSLRTIVQGGIITGWR